MNRSAVALTLLLLAGLAPAPVQAQSADPPPQAQMHVVQRGETMFSIAQRHGLSVDTITHANGISDPREVYVGQQIVIPAGAADNEAEGTTPYVVQASDTLTSIARRSRTSWQTLAQINRLLSPNAIYVGQIIQVPACEVPVDIAVGETGEHPAMHGGMPYILRARDTLFRIGMRYGVSPWAVASASRVSGPGLIYPGRELVVPTGEAGLLPAPFAALQVQPLPAAQGSSIVIVVGTTEPVALRGTLFGEAIAFADAGAGTFYGLCGVHVFTEPGLYDLELRATDASGQETVISTAIVVQDAHFGYERIDVPAGRTALLDPVTVAAETERIDAVRTTFTPERHWALPLQRPCVGPISSYFGTRRAYDDGPYTSYHSGVDFRAPGGTPVYAPTAGIIVLAEPLTIRGNTIVIDHGWGMLTGYWHLSSIEVQVGQHVAPCDLIGKVGNTGLSTGAHLHWETWVGGTSVNGLQWLEEFYIPPESEGVAIGG